MLRWCKATSCGHSGVLPLIAGRQWRWCVCLVSIKVNLFISTVLTPCLLIWIVYFLFFGITRETTTQPLKHPVPAWGNKGVIILSEARLYPQTDTFIMVGRGGRLQQQQHRKHPPPLTVFILSGELGEELRTVDYDHLADLSGMPAGQVVPHPRTSWSPQVR